VAWKKNFTLELNEQTETARGGFVFLLNYKLGAASIDE